MWAKGFGPIASPEATVLILGSMPSQASLREHHYYAHPRNAFWLIIESLFSIPRDLSYAEKYQALSAKKIALWDVYASCFRTGSLDTNIDRTSAEFNDFPHFFSVYTSIHSVFFNGKTAEKAYYQCQLQQALPTLNLRYYSMPSTSPANAMMNVEQKVAQWRTLKEVLVHDEQPASSIHG